MGKPFINKTLQIFMFLVCLGIPCIGFLPSANAFQIKYYGNEKFIPISQNINGSYFTELYNIPIKYFEGIRIIRNYEKVYYFPFDAIYQEGGIITFFDYSHQIENSYYKINLIHELAHHQQFLHKEKQLCLNGYYCSFQHDSTFEKYAEEITNASN